MLIFKQLLTNTAVWILLIIMGHNDSYLFFCKPHYLVYVFKIVLVDISKENKDKPISIRKLCKDTPNLFVIVELSMLREKLLAMLLIQTIESLKYVLQQVKNINYRQG